MKEQQRFGHAVAGHSCFLNHAGVTSKPLGGGSEKKTKSRQSPGDATAAPTRPSSKLRRRAMVAASRHGCHDASQRSDCTRRCLAFSCVIALRCNSSPRRTHSRARAEWL